MRLGFFIGFVIGGAVASLLARSPEQVSDAVEEAAIATDDAKDLAAAEVRQVTGLVKHQVEEACEAAKEAQLEKEAEMLRMYEDMVHRKEPPSA